MPDVTTCLWFRTEAEEAARFYVALLPDSRVTAVTPGAPGGPAAVVEFVLAGRPHTALNHRPDGPGFTPACSLLVACDTQAEIDRLWGALTRDGGQESECGWCMDRFGVSWQVVPRALGALLGGPDAEAAGRAVRAMLGMTKLDVAALERARAGV